MKLSLIEKCPTDPLTPVFYCPVCHSAYGRAADAALCAESFPLAEQFPKLKVGDVVVLNSGYTWYERKEWVTPRVKRADLKSSSHFDHKDTYEFFYVVTAISCHEGYGDHPFQDNRNRHQGIISVVGGATVPRNSKELYHSWTSHDHRRVQRVNDQKAVAHIRNMTKKYLGKIARNLM